MGAKVAPDLCKYINFMGKYKESQFNACQTFPLDSNSQTKRGSEQMIDRIKDIKLNGALTRKFTN